MAGNKPQLLTPDMIDQVRADYKALGESVKELSDVMTRNRSMAPDVLSANDIYLNPGEPHRVLGQDLSRHRVRLSASTDTVYVSPTRSGMETFSGTAIGSGPGFLIPQYPQTMEIQYTGELYAIITGASGGHIYVLTESFAVSI